MKIVIPTCDKYVHTIHAHVHFLHKLWPSCPYEVLVVVGGSAPVPHAKEINARIEHLGQDRLWASNFLETHKRFLQDDQFFILCMDDLVPFHIDGVLIEEAVTVVSADRVVNQIRLAERWVKRPLEKPHDRYGPDNIYVHMRRDRYTYSNKATLWRSSVHQSILEGGETSTRTEGNGTARLRSRGGMNLGATHATLEQMNWISHRGRKDKFVTRWIERHW
ncbi:hypothetical protein LCGC14_0275350 [marine sediment metagenome]|uniref:Glycosyltransferase 2-like domain-containing protein n=1 Tax=marine sediment metagenome TaxID=412755 RepID=A0A0F9TXG5_9ZZZZ